ncbi:MAG: NupC/NupG family nucleoside CNT transporter [Acidobacteria bacterium]|nr:NupC/NupG family nucleoside CNT transporter [Acidobacteriota bacterium]
MGLVGIAAILAASYGLSANRARIGWRAVGWGLALQVGLALLVLKTPFGVVFQVVGRGFNQTMAYAEQGSGFVFGELGRSSGPQGVVLAFQVLPLIIFVASLFAVLYYLGVMQLALRGMAWVMQRSLGVSGAEALNVAANVFMGQNEAPLTIRPYLDKLTRSELMTLMTGGMATISGALMVAYAQIGKAPVENLLTAVVMTAPAAIALAKVFEPETSVPETLGGIPKSSAVDDRNVIDAAARGAGEGLMLSLYVGAMLVAFIGLIALLNGVVGGVKEWTGLGWLPGDVQTVLGWIFAPVAFALGVDWSDAGVVGNLLGTRVVLNEFIAYVELGQLRETLQPRSFLIAGYALCGFANLGSIGVQLGGIGSLIPERRREMAELGLRAMVAATFANFLTAAIAGLLI